MPEKTKRSAHKRKHHGSAPVHDYEWENRGKPVGLIFSDGVPAWFRTFLLLVILAGVWKEPTWQAPCPSGEGGMSLTKAALCEYTKAYVLCFPEIALSVLLLMVGRNLLQKRFYYGLLKAGGVMEYSQNNPLRDPLMLLLFACYFHLLLFLGLILTGAIEPPKLGGASGGMYTKQLKEGQKSMGKDHTGLLSDPAKLALVLNLAGFIVLPGALVVMFLYLSYDLEQSLVPLSGFIEAGGDTEKAEQGVRDLAALRVLEDGLAKPLAEENMDKLNDAHKSKGLKGLYEQLLQLYADECSLTVRLHAVEEPKNQKVKLLNSLWVAQMLLGKEEPAEFPSAKGLGAMGSGAMGGLNAIGGAVKKDGGIEGLQGLEADGMKDYGTMKNIMGGKESTTGFKWLWRAFLAASVTIAVVMLVFFGMRAYGLVLRGMAGKLGYIQSIPMFLVEAMHLVVIILVLWKLNTCSWSSEKKQPAGLPSMGSLDSMSKLEQGGGLGGMASLPGMAQKGPAGGGKRGRKHK